MMIKHYIKIAWRNLIKYKFNSLVDIAGLSVGVAFTLLIGVYVWTELNVNKALQNYENQYIIQSEWKNPNQGNELTTFGALPKALHTAFPHLVANYYRWDGIDVIVSHGAEHFTESCAVGDTTLFDMYGFELAYGNPNSAFEDPYSAVISSAMALKYFGTNNAVGQTLHIQNFNGEKRNFTVSGVLAQLPRNSVTSVNEMNRNQIFLSASVINFFQRQIDSWRNPFIVGYIELQSGISPEQLTEPMKELLTLNTPDNISANLDPYLVSLTEFYRQGENGVVQKQIRVLSIIAFFILLMVMVNFINSSISKANSRMREIGIRKILGSDKSRLIRQFLTESVVIVLIATVLALFIYQACRPLCAYILEKELPSLFSLPLYFILSILCLSICLGILTGLYPSLILSSLKPTDSVQGKLLPRSEKTALQKALVGFQFSIAVIILCSTFIISKQIDYFFSENLGYDKDFLVTAALPRDWTPSGVNKMKTIRDEFTRMAEVETSTLSYDIPNGMNNGGAPVLYRMSDDSTRGVVTRLLMSDEYYSQTYKIPLLAGSFFSGQGSYLDPTKIVINESTAKALRWSNPEEAIGQKIYAQGNPDLLTISGVVKDFHFSSMQDKIQPLCWTHVQFTNGYRYLTFRLQPGNISSSIDALRDKWTQLLPQAPFEYQFLDETLGAMYTSEIQLKKAAVVATLLSTLIVLIGMLSLISLVVQQRNKEIGIRKVLGASVSSVAVTLSKDFGKLVAVAAIIAIPIAWYAMNRWLKGFAYRIDLQWWMFAGAGLVAIVVAMFTVVTQSVRAAMADPTKSLKSE